MNKEQIQEHLINLKTSFNETNAPIAGAIYGVCISLIDNGVPPIVLLGPLSAATSIAGGDILDILLNSSDG